MERPSKLFKVTQPGSALTSVWLQSLGGPLGDGYLVSSCTGFPTPLASGSEMLTWSPWGLYSQGLLGWLYGLQLLLPGSARPCSGQLPGKCLNETQRPQREAGEGQPSTRFLSPLPPSPAPLSTHFLSPWHPEELRLRVFVVGGEWEVRGRQLVSALTNGSLMS